MKNKHNAAIIILAARIPLLIEVLKKLYFNWNKKFNYPIYIHTFGKLINERKQGEIKKLFTNPIHFCEIRPEFPEHIPEKELYYNRKYLAYVSKAFPKKRSGYLHMCYFKTNITKYGFKGCLDKQLEKYDKLMFYDDDCELIEKVDFDLFDLSNEYPIVTGYLTKRKVDQELRDITENLWEFYKKFMKNKNIVPKNNLLREAIAKDNPEVVFDLSYSCGALEIFNIKLFNNKYWESYLDAVNHFGGNYKYRWGDMQVTNLFSRTFFDKPIYNLDFINKGILNSKIKGSEQFIYFGSLDSYSSKLFNYIVKFKKFIFS